MAITTTTEVLNRCLPPQIRTAQVSLAMQVPLWDLPNRVLRLAQILASHTPLSALDKPVMCSRAKAAELLGVCARSVSRYFGELEDRGLIQLLRQRCDRDGSWKCGEFLWTASGRSLFVASNKQRSVNNNLPRDVSCVPDKICTKDNVVDAAAIEERPTSSVERVENEIRETKLAHRTEVEKQEVLFRNKTACVPVKKKQTDWTLKRLPADIVEPARQLGLCREQVCFLFREVKKKGQILQDILAVSLKAMTDGLVRGRRAVGWILTLLEKNRDYRRLADQQRKYQEKQAQKALDDARLNQIATNIKHGQITPCGNVIDQVAGDFVTLSDPKTGKTIGSERKDNLAKRIDCKKAMEPDTSRVDKEVSTVEKVCRLYPKTISHPTPSDIKKNQRDVEMSTIKALLKKKRGKRSFL